MRATSHRDSIGSAEGCKRVRGAGTGKPHLVNLDDFVIEKVLNHVSGAICGLRLPITAMPAMPRLAPNPSVIPSLHRKVLST